MPLDKKSFLKMDTMLGKGPNKKITEIEKVTITGPTKMFGVEYLSQENPSEKDIPVFNSLSKMWEFKNLSELLVENKTTREIIIKGVTQGGYVEGITIPVGTSFEDIIQNMLTMVIPAVYTNPSGSINGSNNKVLEAGTVISPIITPSFIQNDAGDISRYTLTKNGNTILDVSNVKLFTDSNVLIGDTNVYYDAKMYYKDGAIKLNNLGELSSDGQIKAGILNTNRVTYTGVRNMFYGCSGSSNAEISNDTVRALLTELNPKIGTTIKLDIPAGTQKIIIGYPSTLRDMSSVNYIEGLNAEVKGIFQKTLYNISGANNYNPIEYKIYTYIPDVPFSNNATYNIII